MSRRTLFDAAGAMIADVRQRLVEEGFFGRIVTPRPLASSEHDQHCQSFAEQLGWERPAGHDDPEHGLDR